MKTNAKKNDIHIQITESIRKAKITDDSILRLLS